MSWFKLLEFHPLTYKLLFPMFPSQDQYITISQYIWGLEVKEHVWPPGVWWFEFSEGLVTKMTQVPGGKRKTAFLLLNLWLVNWNNVEIVLVHFETIIIPIQVIIWSHLGHSANKNARKTFGHSIENGSIGQFITLGSHTQISNYKFIHYKFQNLGRTKKILNKIFRKPLWCSV